MQKVASLDIPDHVFNWMVDFLNGHSHCTLYSAQSLPSRTLQQVLGLSRAPALASAAYVINPVIFRQSRQATLCKFANDT